MAPEVRLTKSAIDHFHESSPSPEDLESLTNALRQISEVPAAGTRVPFAGLDDEVYVAWGGKWRIVYRIGEPSGIDVLNVERQV